MDCEGSQDRKSVEKVLFSAGEKQEPSCWQLEKDLGVRHRGCVEGQEVRDILLDTGWTRTMVQAYVVAPEKILEGDAMEIQCVHGDSVWYPLANVR